MDSIELGENDLAFSPLQVISFIGGLCLLRLVHLDFETFPSSLEESFVVLSIVYYLFLVCWAVSGD